MNSTRWILVPVDLSPGTSLQDFAKSAAMSDLAFMGGATHTAPNGPDDLATRVARGARCPVYSVGVDRDWPRIRSTRSVRATLPHIAVRVPC